MDLGDHLSGRPGPWQQVVDLLGRTGCDADEDIGPVGVGIVAVELGGLCRPPNYAERLLRPWRYEALCPDIRNLARW